MVGMQTPTQEPSAKTTQRVTLPKTRLKALAFQPRDENRSGALAAKFDLES